MFLGVFQSNCTVLLVGTMPLFTNDVLIMAIQFIVLVSDHLCQAFLHTLIQVGTDENKNVDCVVDYNRSLQARNHCQDGHRPLETAVRMGIDHWKLMSG